MLSESRRSRVFARRVFILGGFKSALFLTLIGRLYYLQGIKSDEYKTFSDSNRIKLSLIPPLRGKIFDRNGVVVAENRNYYRILFDPESSRQPLNTIKKLATILRLPEEERLALEKKVRKHNLRTPLLLREHLDWKAVSRVEVHAPDLPGVFIDVGQVRYYPYSTLAPHLLGYLGPLPQKELDANPLLNHPDFKVGKSGVEKSFESTLRGKAGVKRIEVNAFGLSIRELSREDSVGGRDLYLTIDKELQSYVNDQFTDVSGSAVIVDVRNGDILALSSMPNFDPNEFTYGVSPQYWSELTANLDKPLINKVLSNQYPPGSTFKMIVALTALEAGVDPYKKVYCPGYVVLGRRRFHCWKDGGHGHVNMVDALAHSCNSYFYTIAKQLDVDDIHEMALKFGIGETHDIALQSQKNGLVPTQKWKERVYREPWQKGDTLNTAIGQGFVLSTPLQLAVMVSRLATGKKVALSSALMLEETSGKQFDDIDVDPTHLQLVREGMRKVVNMPGGTAYRSRIVTEGFSMAGKTGTSQVISKKNMKALSKIMTEDELKRKKNHALFVGFGPVENPRYAVSVVVEHGGGGSATAAPIAKKILLKTYQLLGGGQEKV